MLILPRDYWSIKKAAYAFLNTYAYEFTFPMGNTIQVVAKVELASRFRA
jgi:hypothetical protein